MKRSTIVKTMLLLLLAAFQHNLSAADFNAVCSSGQRIYYNILSDSTVAITYPRLSNNNYYYGYTKPSGNMTIPATVVHGSNTYHVISIGANAFHSCTNLTSVSIPSSVTVISDGAFNHCSGLTSITIPSTVLTIGVGAFQGCSGLVTAQLGSNIGIIGSVAFEGCTSLRAVNIPNSVTILGNWAFSNCSSLDTLTIGTSLSQISYTVFAGCNNVRHIYYNAINAVCSFMTSGGYQSSLPVSSLHSLVIGDSVQTLHSYSFTNATSLDSVSIGLSLATIDTCAFIGCSNVHYLCYNAVNCSDASFCSTQGSTPSHAFRPFTQLSSLTLGSSVLRIPSYAFYGMTGITSLALPQSLQTIGNYSFAQCNNINTLLLLPNTLTSIGSFAFQGCSHLNSTIQFPASLTTIGIGAFRDCDSIFFLNTGTSPAAIPAEAFYGCDRLFQITIGSNTPSIGDSAFSNCSRLTSATLGAALTAIGNNAFRGCYRLVTPLFPHSLTSIGPNAFYGCSLLGEQLTFPASLSYIGNGAFSNTASIATITMLGSTPPAISSGTFGSASSSTHVFVPCGALLAYFMADYWENFTNLTETSPYSLTLYVNNPIMGSASVTQQPGCTSSVAIIQAVANTDYHFLRWNDGNTANPRTLNINSDTTFTAYFVSDYSYITVTCNDSTRGSVSGTGLYSYNATATLTATPLAGFHFQRWSDGNTDNPRYITATQDSLFTAIFLSNNSTITVLNNNPTMGTVSGGGNYYYQNQAVISATPFAGHHFTFWNDGVTTNPRTIVVSQDSTFTANFAVNLYTVTATSNNNTMGSVTGGGSYSYLATVELTATAFFGHHFVQWSDGVTTNPRSFQVTADTAFTAIFTPNTYTVQLLSNDTSMGTVYGGGTYNYAATANLSASAVYGCHFVQWSDGSTDNPRTLTVTGNTTLTAMFAVNTYSLTVLSNNNTMGNVTGSGTYTHNTPVNITAQANYGYHFVSWNDGDTNNPRLITMTHDATYTALFALNSYTVTAISANIAYGTVSGSGTYNYNSPALITATPFYGYHFVQWNDGSTDNPRSIVVTEDIGFTAIFAVNNYIVTANSNSPARGSVTGGGTYSYQSVATLTALPADHHHFVQWDDADTNNPRTLTVISDTSFTAHFVIDSYYVAVTTLDTLRGHVEGAGTIAYGNTANLIAVPNYGYYFSSWSDGVTQNPRPVIITSDTSFFAIFLPNIYQISVLPADTLQGTTIGSGIYEYGTQITIQAIAAPHNYFTSWNDGITTNPRVINVTRDSNIIALFQADPSYTITVNSNDITMGSVTGSGTYQAGEEITITATPTQHHIFKYWSDGNSDNPRTVRVLNNATYTAIFALQTFTIHATPNNTEMGAVYGAGTYNFGEHATLLARPFPGFSFREWSDGNTNAERSILVDRNITLQAIFYNTVGIDQAESEGITVLTNGQDITINGVEGRHVSLYDIMGRRIASQSAATNTLNLRVPATGIYMLHIDGSAARKIVVR